MKKKDKIFIIAEVGVNHNGSLKKALKLVDLAVSAGADAIKFQTFKAENLATKNAPKADYQILNSSKKETQFKMLKKLEFTDSMHRTCLNECKKKKIIFMSSAFDINNLYYLKKLNLKYFKVPSGEITNIPYLEVLGKFNKKVILSTGMSSINEIEQAIKILKKNGTSKNKIVLMQCTSAYPAPNEEMNLKIINTFINRFKLKVGLSDHSLGTQAPIAAVSLGATLIEKHMTLDNNLQGPDHKASLNPMDFKLMVKNIRITEQMLGSKKKKITKTEKKKYKNCKKIYSCT